MTIERLREHLTGLLLIASDDIRRAREDGDSEQAARIEVERDTLFRVLALIDADPDEV